MVLQRQNKRIWRSLENKHISMYTYVFMYVLFYFILMPCGIFKARPIFKGKRLNTLCRLTNGVSLRSPNHLGELASGICMTSHSPVHMGIKGGGTHPLIQVFALEPSGCLFLLPITLLFT